MDFLSDGPATLFQTALDVDSEGYSPAVSHKHCKPRNTSAHKM